MVFFEHGFQKSRVFSKKREFIGLSSLDHVVDQLESLILALFAALFKAIACFPCLAAAGR